MRDVKCLFISPEANRVGELHRHFSVKELADMIAVKASISDMFMTYKHMLDFPSVHKFICDAQFKADKATMGSDLSLDIDSIINVPAKMLVSPLQVAASKAYYAIRNDQYAPSVGPVIMPFDVTEDETLCGWTPQEHSSDI